MKNHSRAVLSAILALIFVLSLSSSVCAAPLTAVLTGPPEAHAGDVLQITLRVRGDGVLSFLGDLTYDPAQGTVTEVRQQISSGWTLSAKGSRVICFADDEGAKALKGETSLFTVYFRLRSDLAEGTEVKLGLINAYCSDGENDLDLPDAEYSVTLLPPRSSDATLASLTAENASLSPAFSPDRTEYSASVPYSEKSLKLVPVPADENASYRISGNTLSVGSNKVTVRVTAENGSTKTYTVNVTRGQDPNYVPGSDASLKSIVPSSGILSPSFSRTRTEYVLYLPHEIDGITLRGTPNDARGSCPSVTFELKEGKNELVIRGIAEDGSESEYRIWAVRLPAFRTEEDIVLPAEETEPPETAAPETEPQTEAPGSETSPVTETVQKETGAPQTEPRGKEDPKIRPAIAILLLIPLLLAGIVAAVLLAKKKKNEKNEE